VEKISLALIHFVSTFSMVFYSWRLEIFYVISFIVVPVFAAMLALSLAARYPGYNEEIEWEGKLKHICFCNLQLLFFDIMLRVAVFKIPLAVLLILWYHDIPGVVGFIVGFTSFVVELILRNITVIVSVVGILVMGCVFCLRYLRARVLEIPFRVTYFSLQESLDTIALLAALGGMGFLVPFLIAAVNYQEQFMHLNGVLIISVSAKTLVAIWLLWRYSAAMRKDEQPNLKVTVLFWVLVPLFTAAYAAAAVGVVIFAVQPVAGFAQHALMPTSIVVYLLGMCFCLVFYTLEKTYRITLHKAKDGKKLNTEMTAAIAGRDYLIAMRHSKSEWILIPCEIRKNSKNENTMEFQPGSFIIKSLSELDSINKDSFRRIYSAKDEPGARG